ncbi:hypothetical protein KXR87_14545 [Yokenella regensburgei]|uniref:hypothetical protein n=1 Tax=Yokenella regensburgei TaxID=158877 RepID=UPI003F15ADD2
MPTYTVSTQIRSNVKPEDILYDLLIYRMDSRRNKHILVDVTQQQIQSNYETQRHITQETDDPFSTMYIMKVTLYWKGRLGASRIHETPFTKMYTLAEFSSGRAWSSIKRENPCFFVTTGYTRRVKPGETNIQEVKISRPERPFIAKEYPIGHDLDPFERSTIREQITTRFNQLDYPNQGWGSLCGPAAFFYCLQIDRPDVYAQAARELWCWGKTKIGELEIVPGEGCRHPSGEFYDHDLTPPDPIIPGVDWITLASLRDSENAVINYDTVDSPAAGVTMWQTLTEWFQKAGYELVFCNAGITRGSVEDIHIFNDYVNRGYKVVTLVAGGLLDGNDSIFTVPNHWIVWNSQLTQSDRGEISLALFSWGKVKNHIKSDMTTRRFLNRFFGGMVFKPLK